MYVRYLFLLCVCFIYEQNVTECPFHYTFVLLGLWSNTHSESMRDRQKDGDRDWERFASRDRPVTGRTLWWTHYCWQLVCDLMCSPAENSSVESIELGITLLANSTLHYEDGRERSMLPECSGCISFKGSETVKTYPNHTCGVFLQNWHR